MSACLLGVAHAVRGYLRCRILHAAQLNIIQSKPQFSVETSVVLGKAHLIQRKTPTRKEKLNLLQGPLQACHGQDLKLVLCSALLCGALLQVRCGKIFPYCR